MAVEILRADYSNHNHAEQIITLLDAYARDPMGGGQGLCDQAKTSLVHRLSEIPGAFSVLAMTDGKAVGLVNCFEGFSTFAARTLINIHDVFVLEDFRGQKISQRMLTMVEQIALERGCCKLTLEVLSNNLGAKTAYYQFGFSDYQLDPTAGTAIFLEKKL